MPYKIENCDMRILAMVIELLLFFSFYGRLVQRFLRDGGEVMLETMGWVSIVPALLAVLLALWTKDTILSLVVACITGCFLAGKGVFGFTNLIQSALGNEDFIWTVLCILPFGVIAAYFQKSGAIDGFNIYINEKQLGRKKTLLTAWALGLFCFADSMSPLFVGTTMRKLSDSAKVSREKLAYIADATAACVSVVYPFTGWSGYLASLAVGIGCIANIEQGQALMLKAIPFNFYAIFSIFMAGLISAGIIKDYGPMKTAEKRTLETGAVLADGATPLVSRELFEMKKSDSIKTRVFLNFVFPSVMLFVLAIGSFFVLGGVKIVESVVFVVIFMSISLFFQGMKLRELADTFMDGVKGIAPALLIISLAYCLNALSKEMGTANFIINMTKGFLTPKLLPCIIFLVAATLSFATGTSWGTFAICMPLALPIAFNITNNQVTTLVAACFAAVAGGGTFGDHCSPVSDTTIMASMGAASDHVDHVKTQLPYAITVAAISSVILLIIGCISA